MILRDLVIDQIQLIIFCVFVNVTKKEVAIFSSFFQNGTESIKSYLAGSESSNMASKRGLILISIE